MIPFLLILFLITLFAMFLLCREILWGIKNGKKKIHFFEEQLFQMESVQIKNKYQLELTEEFFSKFKHTNKKIVDDLWDLNFQQLQKKYSPKG